jgi:hypothetical protein
MDLSRLQAIKAQQAQDASIQKRHTDLLLDNNKTQEVIVKSFSLLVDYLSKNTTKTEVVNQLREIGTPDVKHVVSAVDSLHSTLKKHENTDLTEITKVMQGVLEEAKKIPKELPKTEKQQFIDYSKQFKALEDTIKTVEKAIQAQELKVEAPVVNVEPKVNVEPTDLNPIKDSVEKSSKEVVKAVKAIPTPEFKTDPIEKLLKKTNKLLEDLPELMPSGGGGGGSSWVATNDSGIPVPIQLTAEGKVPVEAGATSTYQSFNDTTTDANLVYLGKSTPGTATSDAAWQIKRYNKSAGTMTFADDITTFTKTWDNRTSYGY